MREDSRGGVSSIRRGSERARDFIALTMSVVVVLSILAASGALGWIEAVTAAFIVGAAALAYYVGSSSPSVEAQTVAEAAEPERAPSASLDGVVETLPYPSVHIDAAGRVAASNEAARRILRIPRGRPTLASAVFRRPELLRMIEQALLSDPVEPVQVELDPRGDQVWTARASRLQPPFDGVILNFEDRTAVRRAERARADFLANASHELRTPLTSLLGYIETMRGPAKDDKKSWDRFLKTMHDQAERMKRLIHDLLSLSRIELDEHRAPDTVVDFAILARETVDALRPVAAERRISIKVEGPEESLRVTAVRDELVQVVQNLVDNAVKYSEHGGEVSVSFGSAEDLARARAVAVRQWEDARRMTLFAAPGEDSAAKIWLRVADEGPGIERHHLPRLGERFYRADESRGGAIGGTGLGLAIVKHIVARHKGGLAVETVEGKGSAFAAWLPSCEAADVTHVSNAPPISAE
ncbi:MAG: ATP-binding protein [Pseudomonadota bacterium]